MFGNFFKKKNSSDDSEINTHGEEDTSLVKLSYFKVPQTLEVKKRQQEEMLRTKYKIPKDKTGIML